MDAQLRRYPKLKFSHRQCKASFPFRYCMEPRLGNNTTEPHVLQDSFFFLAITATASSILNAAGGPTAPPAAGGPTALRAAELAACIHPPTLSCGQVWRSRFLKNKQERNGLYRS